MALATGRRRCDTASTALWHTSCRANGTGEGVPMADETLDNHVLAPGRAPTPFTADEIRDATKVGKAIRRRIDEVGEAPFYLVSRYVECDRDGAVLERSRLALDGSPLGEPEVNRMT